MIEGLHVSDDVRWRNPGLVKELEEAKGTTTPSKYRNTRTEAKGMTFQSGHEAAGVSALIIAEEQHKIFALRLQVRFPLPGKTVYVADAVYLDAQLQPHILDFKAWDVKTRKYLETKEYKLKKRLFKATYGQDIEEA